MIVCKFGGSSLADARQFRKVRAILLEDPDRRYVVCSAPGKNAEHNHKITDLLYLCRRHAGESLPFDDVFEHIAGRFRTIAAELKVGTALEAELEKIRRAIASGFGGADYAASRGEHLCGLLLSEYLGFEFLDPMELIFFDASGRLDRAKTLAAVKERLPWHKRAVIPGFYGAGPDGGPVVFSRGGSDVTGALIAAGGLAEVYENWTDISGLRMADPRVVPNAVRITQLTYRELRELAYMGAEVLHDEAIFPVREAGIPVHVKNTNAPEDAGTMIVENAPVTDRHGGLSGIAGRKDFTVIAMEKALMNREVGFGRRALDVLARHGVSYEHTPTGIDSFGIVLDNAQARGKLEALVEDLRADCRPDFLDVHGDMALVAVVGRGMAHRTGVAAKVFTALARAGVNVRMIDQGSSEINIILGVETKDFEKSVEAIYRAFVVE